MSTNDKYLTAAQLGITQKERLALTLFLEGLKDGRFGHERYGTNPYEERDYNTPMIGFDMGIASSTYHCHTVRCIGGWMGTIMGFDLENGVHDYVFNTHSKALDKLFFPTKEQMDKINQADAVRAIENFLTIGKPHWDAVVEPLMGVSHTDSVPRVAHDVMREILDGLPERDDAMDVPKLEDKS